jgi:hypothetical protein
MIIIARDRIKRSFATIGRPSEIPNPPRDHQKKPWKIFVALILLPWKSPD